MPPPFPPRRAEDDGIANEARQVAALTPEERAEIFVGLDRTMDAVLAGLPADERRRRREAARAIDPLPSPWWIHLRRSEWPRRDAER